MTTKRIVKHGGKYYVEFRRPWFPFWVWGLLSIDAIGDSELKPFDTMEEAMRAIERRDAKDALEREREVVWQG